MAAQKKPYDSFGPFILFKKLEADSLGDLWRAARIEDGQLGPAIALRRLSGGRRDALVANAEAVAPALPRISGASFVRGQQAGVADGVPFLSWEYASGRSLRHVIDRSRGGKDAQPNPLPIDQAIVVAEKVALSLATMADLRDTSGGRLCHGAVIPQFIWITDDGEIRVAGQLLGSGVIASLSHPDLASDVGRYFSPEYRASGVTQRNTDVYSLGAVLFLLVTGQEPPDAATASAFVAAVRAARTADGSPIPADIRLILDKSFNLDPSMRYPSMAEMKQALSALSSSGRYSATTFNLAFYLTTLLKKEMETEAAEREKEAKVVVAPYLERPVASAPLPAAVAAEVQPHTPAPAMFAKAVESKKKNRLPLVAALLAVVAGGGAAAYVMMTKNASQPAQQQIAAAQVLPAAAAPAPDRLISEPIIATSDEPEAAQAAEADPEAQKKAFEEAVRQKLQAEMMKLQNDYMAELKKQQSKNAPVAAPPAVVATPPAQTQAAQTQTVPPPVADERPRMTAAELDQQRLQARQAESAAAERAATVQATPPVAPPPQQPAKPAVIAPAPAQVAAVRDGDVVDVASLDSIPRPLRAIRPTYPPMALRQKVAATIILTAFISETGEVQDVKVLRGEPRFGLNDAAIRAIRSTRYSPPMKDGKRVKTWMPQTIEFVP